MIHTHMLRCVQYKLLINLDPCYAQYGSNNHQYVFRKWFCLICIYTLDIAPNTLSITYFMYSQHFNVNIWIFAPNGTLIERVQYSIFQKSQCEHFNASVESLQVYIIYISQLVTIRQKDLLYFQKTSKYFHEKTCIT